MQVRCLALNMNMTFIFSEWSMSPHQFTLIPLVSQHQWAHFFWLLVRRASVIASPMRASWFTVRFLFWLYIYSLYFYTEPSGGASGQASDIAIHAKEILRIRQVLTSIYQRHCARSGESEADGLARFGQFPTDCCMFCSSESVFHRESSGERLLYDRYCIMYLCWSWSANSVSSSRGYGIRNCRWSSWTAPYVWFVLNSHWHGSHFAQLPRYQYSIVLKCFFPILLWAKCD